MKKIRNLLLGLLAAASVAFNVQSAQTPALHSVTLAWDPNPDTQSAGFIVYYGLASGSYAWTTNVGYATNAVISGLLEATTYFFAVTSYDTNGVESDFSNEISYTPYGLQDPVLVILGASNRLHTINMGWTAPPVSYTVLSYSTNGTTWSSTTNLPSVTNKVISLAGIPTNTVVTFKLTAVDTNGVSSTSSNVIYRIPVTPRGPLMRFRSQVSQACDPLGPWEAVPGASIDLVVEASDESQRFYRSMLDVTVLSP